MDTLSDRLPGYNPAVSNCNFCDCCKPDEPKLFWLDSFAVEIFWEEMEDGEIGYCAWVDLHDAAIHTGVKSSYPLAKIAAREIVDRELALKRVFDVA